MRRPSSTTTLAAGGGFVAVTLTVLAGRKVKNNKQSLEREFLAWLHNLTLPTDDTATDIILQKFQHTAVHTMDDFRREVPETADRQWLVRVFSDYREKHADGSLKDGQKAALIFGLRGSIRRSTRHDVEDLSLDPDVDTEVTSSVGPADRPTS